MEKLNNFKFIGVSIETTNENGQSSNDLQELWERFYSENIPTQIPNKVSDEIYSIYTDYETNYKGKYTCIIGFKVNSLDEIPENLIGREFKGGQFQKFIAKGQMPDAVVETWQKIWQKEDELNRKYTVDFEVYRENSRKGEGAEVQIFISIK